MKSRIQNFALFGATLFFISCDCNGQRFKGAVSQVGGNCEKGYPDVCVPKFPPDLDCDEVQYQRFRVTGSDPHGFDRDRDGLGCE